MSCHPEDESFIVTHFFWACILKSLHTYLSRPLPVSGFLWNLWNVHLFSGCILTLKIVCLFCFVFASDPDWYVWWVKGLTSFTEAFWEIHGVILNVKIFSVSSDNSKGVGSSLIPKLRQKIKVKKWEWLKRGPGWPQKREQRFPNSFTLFIHIHKKIWQCPPNKYIYLYITYMCHYS